MVGYINTTVFKIRVCIIKKDKNGKGKNVAEDRIRFRLACGSLIYDLL